MEKIKSYQEDSEVQKNRWWILVSVAMFTFMSTLDSSSVLVYYYLEKLATVLEK